MKKRGLLFLFVFGLLACGQLAGPPPTPFFSQAVELDCLADSPTCPELVIAGDQFSGESFQGFADGTMRYEEVSGRIWFAYSWPTVHRLANGRGVPGVDIHLAYSEDNGQSWSYYGPLWLSEPAHNPENNEAGYTDHEVANLLVVTDPAGVRWFGVRLDYFLPENGGFNRRPQSSFRLVISQADSAPALAQSPTATLGSHYTAAGWQIDSDLSTLAPQLSNCDMWNEPALYFEQETLYLIVRCLVFGNQHSQSSLVVFATQPTENVQEWVWRYVGELAGQEEATQLGAEGLTQIDLTQSIDGQLLAIVTPDQWRSELNDFVHYGCYVLEVASIEPPQLARDEHGVLKVRAIVTASDQLPLGPAACTYDPASRTGLIIGRRIKAQGMMTAWLHQTGLNP